MADTSVHITAGLPVAKDSGQSPGAGDTSAFITAGLPKVVEAVAGFVSQKALIIGGGILGT